ncbi:MAG: hypothetical protein KGI73_02815, partial [Patescibacteria group bacterium]|nr:hypothetical protein [Patescibacteria group bacterium]
HVLAASQATMGEYVRQYFADTPIMADIAWCESRDRQWNLDGTTFHGAVNHDDIGIMQINTAYHGTEAKQLGYDLYSLSGNMEFAKYLYAHEGTQPWSSSEACWGKLAAR